MTSYNFVAGEPAPLDAADRGLAYGDGLFETMAVAAGRIERLDLHLERLTEGCERLRIPIPDIDWLRSKLAVAAETADRAVLKLIVTRGRGERGYRPPARPEPTVIVAMAPWPEQAAAQARDGIRVRTCTLRLGENPYLAGMKHLCRLEQVLAQLELEGTGIDEGLLLNTSDWVISGISSNVFAASGAAIKTPRLTRSGVAGVMRRVVLERAPALGFQIEESDLDLRALAQADEIFVTNTLTGIRPVRELDGRLYRIGAATRALQNSLGEGVDA